MKLNNESEKHQLIFKSKILNNRMGINAEVYIPFKIIILSRNHQGHLPKHIKIVLFSIHFERV